MQAPAGHNGWGNNSGVRLLQLRKDGFVSIEAPYPDNHELADQVRLPACLPVSIRHSIYLSIRSH